MDYYVIVKIALLGLVCAIACSLLKRSGRDDIATVVSIACLIVSLIMLVDMVSQLFDTVKTLFNL